MRKVASLLSLAASSLLLAGCDKIPKSLEEIIGWREKFHVPITANDVQTYLWIILMGLIAFAFLRSIGGIVWDIQNETPFQESNLAWVLAMYISIGMIYVLIPVANQITVKLLPNDITIDSLLRSLHLTLSFNPAKMWSQAMAVNLSIFLPILISYCLLNSLIISVLATTLSIITKRSKALWVMMGVWIGHLIFILMFIMVKDVLDKLYPSWELEAALSNSSATFNFLIGSVGFISYIAIPLAGIATPEFFGPKSVLASHPRKKIDVDAIIPLLIPSGTPQRKETPPPTPQPTSHSNDEILEGEFHEYPTQDGVIYGDPPQYPRLGSSKPPEININFGGPQDGGGPSSDLTPHPGGSGESFPDPHKIPPAPRKRATPPGVTVINPHQAPPPTDNSHTERTQKLVRSAGNMAQVGATVFGHPEVARTIGLVQAGAERVIERRKTPDPDAIPPLPKKGGSS